MIALWATDEAAALLLAADVLVFVPVLVVRVVALVAAAADADVLWMVVAMLPLLPMWLLLSLLMTMTRDQSMPNDCERGERQTALGH